MELTFLFEKVALSPIKFLEVCFSYRKMLTKSVRHVDRAGVPGYACADKIRSRRAIVSNNTTVKKTTNNNAHHNIPQGGVNEIPNGKEYGEQMYLRENEETVTITHT